MTRHCSTQPGRVKRREHWKMARLRGCILIILALPGWKLPLFTMMILNDRFSLSHVGYNFDLWPEKNKCIMSAK